MSGRTFDELDRFEVDIDLLLHRRIDWDHKELSLGEVKMKAVFFTHHNYNKDRVHNLTVNA